MNTSLLLCRMLACLAVLVSVPAQAVGENVYGSLVFQRTDYAKDGWGFDHYVDAMERFDIVNGAQVGQIGKVEIDVDAGRIRGFHSAIGQSIEATTTIAQWTPLVKVVAPAGAAPNDRVLLDLRVTLNASFLAGDLTPMNAYAVNTFTAELAPYYDGAPSSAWRAQVLYDYYWRRDFVGDDFDHQGFANLNPFGCAGCIAEVIVPDPLNQIRNGFHDITLRVALAVMPETVLVPYLRIKGESSIFAHSAVGNWMETAQIGYLLPPGYALATADGTLLDAWNLAPVPEPRQFALFAAGLAMLALAARRRRLARLHWLRVDAPPAAVRAYRNTWFSQAASRAPASARRCSMTGVKRAT